METPFPLFHNQLPIEPQPGRWKELHLYTGARCNRACAFCCVSGDPTGDYTPWSEPVLHQALRLVSARGSLKFYGGEPTLDPENMLWAMGWLRESGFAGVFTIFSNGIQARALLRLLDSDPRTLAVLNYSIAAGRGEAPLPARAMARLREWATANPERLFISHDFVVPVGRQEGQAAYAEGEAPTRCFRCFPVLTSSGLLHACPFAVEESQPHYWLGDTDTPAELALSRFTRFLAWVESALEPQAAVEGVHPCALCVTARAPALIPTMTPSGLSPIPLPILPHIKNLR